MRSDIKRAIARITGVRDDHNKVCGTAFLVTERHLLTAFHVVGDRIQSSLSEVPLLYSRLRVSLPDSGLSELPAKVADACFDVMADWALVELDEPTTGILPLMLGDLSLDTGKQGKSRTFESWGFPGFARMAGGALFIDGRIQGALTQDPGLEVYQLYSDNVAAGQSVPFNGFSGAPCLVDGAVVGIIRSNLVAPSNRDAVAAGVLFACPINNETLQTRCARYLPALDPILGLPGLPHQTLPSEPFRYLRWYGAEHAEIFFGRSRKLRELYTQVVDKERPSVVLVYGASGVGKSSLLEAGLLPRLAWSHEAVAHRREAGKTLVQLFNDRLDAALAAAESSKKPVVLVVDQIEEAFTGRSFDGNAELSALGQRLECLQNQRDDTRVLLGFRSEWLAEVRARLNEAKVNFAEFYLERLSHDEVAEVVRGIVSTRRLRSWYGVGIDEDLPARIASDLLSDPKSPITPILSIILTRLWQEAKKEPAGRQFLSLALYDVRMRGKVGLDQFLGEQVGAVAEAYRQDVESGLVDDILYRHTTDYGTALELSRSETVALYAHLVDRKYDLQGLLDALLRNALLYTVATTDAGQSTRLAHDTLAPPVRRRYDRSEKLGQRALRRLSDRAKEWDPVDPSADTLDAASLELVQKGLVGSRAPTEKERTYLDASREAIEKSRRHSRRNRLAVTSGICVAVIVAVIWWQQQWFQLTLYRFSDVHTVPTHSLSTEDSFRECAHCPEMVVVPAGSITIGSPTAVVKEMAREQPAKMVDFDKPIAVSKYEITNDEWDKCVSFSFCSPRADPTANGKAPTTNVSWVDARGYALWLAKVTGKDYRLLSEAEWEYAARSGKSTYFSFGNDEKELDRYAWYGGGLELTEPQEVGKKLPNDFGLFDMLGNVSEWVADCFRDNYGDGPQKEPWADAACIRHVIRGGSYVDKPRALRSSARDWSGSGGPTIGIRVGRPIEPGDLK